MRAELHHLESPIEAIGRSRGVLRTDNGGGMLLVVDTCRHDRIG
ncbi:MAG: hypothetical protein R3B67_00330 [Phycisphaerales bacterium]